MLQGHVCKFDIAYHHTNLSGHIHDGDGVGPVANYNMVRVLGHEQNTVDVNVSPGRRAPQ